MNIKDLAKEERPREKALKYGVSVLSNKELLAILLRSGTSKHGVLEIADGLLEKGVSLNGIAGLEKEEFMQVDGISTIKAIELMAHFELAKRMIEETIPMKFNVKSPESLYEYLRLEKGGKTQEEFMVIYLDGGNNILEMETLFKGSENCSVVSVKEILRKAILKGAASIVVAHNHPSGNMCASEQDLMLTKRLKEASYVFNIAVLDHIIITKRGCMSLKREGLM